MFRRDSTAEQVARLEADIVRVRCDQRNAQYQLEAAVSTELRALGMVDSSRAVQDRCRRMVQECADGICSLQDEIAELVPKPRDP